MTAISLSRSLTLFVAIESNSTTALNRSSAAGDDAWGCTRVVVAVGGWVLCCCCCCCSRWHFVSCAQCTKLRRRLLRFRLHHRLSLFLSALTAIDLTFVTHCLTRTSQSSRCFAYWPSPPTTHTQTHTHACLLGGGSDLFAVADFCLPTPCLPLPHYAAAFTFLAIEKVRSLCWLKINNFLLGARAPFSLSLRLTLSLFLTLSCKGQNIIRH